MKLRIFSDRLKQMAVLLFAAATMAISCGNSSQGKNGNTSGINSPSGLTAVAVSTSEINLSWVDNSGDEDGFKIERADDSSGVPGAWSEIDSVTENVVSYSNSGLTSLTKYYYRVRAYNSIGNSDYTSTVSATTQAALTVPAAPSGLAASAVSSTSISLI